MECCHLYCCINPHPVWSHCVNWFLHKIMIKLRLRGLYMPHAPCSNCNVQNALSFKCFVWNRRNTHSVQLTMFCACLAWCMQNHFADKFDVRSVETATANYGLLYIPVILFVFWTNTSKCMTSMTIWISCWCCIRPFEGNFYKYRNKLTMDV